jgi:uncharacterized protein (DUF1778 family)
VSGVSQETVPGGRSEQLRVRLSSDQKLQLEVRAKLAGVSMAKYVLDAALGSRSDVVVSAAERRELLVALTALRADVGKLGSNVNQIARAANIAGSVIFDDYDLETILSSVGRALEAVDSRLGLIR